jgi:hypothetical protein
VLIACSCTKRAIEQAKKCTISQARTYGAVKNYKHHVVVVMTGRWIDGLAHIASSISTPGPVATC